MSGRRGVDLEGRWLPCRLGIPEMAWLRKGFDLIEQEFGRDWIEKTRGRVLHGGASRSLTATVDVAAIGWMLADVRTVDRIDVLREKIAKHDRSAVVELRGIHLLSRVLRGAKMEYAPPVVRSGSPVREADVRVQASNGEWVYAEIAARLETEREAEIGSALRAVSSTCDEGRAKGVNAHVRLNRPPTPSEIACIREAVSHGALGAVQVLALPGDLGDVVLDGTIPGHMVLTTRHGTQELQGTKVTVPVEADGAGVLVVSITHSDHRIEKIVHDEASQLPKDSPSLVLIYRTSGTRGAATWLNRLRRHFASGRFTHPSGAWLFQCDHPGVPTDGTLSYAVAGTANPHAAARLPPEVVGGIEGLTDPLAAAWASRFPDDL